MQTAQQTQLRYSVQCPTLPLAVYREVAAHLRQVEGVQTGLTPMPTRTPTGEVLPFEYTRSQVGSLWIQYPENADPKIRQQVDQILAYYSERYGAWTTVEASEDK